MAILSFPSITPDNVTFGIRYNTQVSTSDISGVIQTVEIPGARWVGSMIFRDMTLEESATLKAFLLKLRGSAGKFYYSDISHTNPFTTVTGSLSIETGSTPRLIKVTVTSGNFDEADYIQIGNNSDESRELKMIVSSSIANSPNTYDLIIEPMIRRIDYVGLSAIYTNPKGVFMLTSSDQANWAIRSKANLSDISLDFIEI